MRSKRRIICPICSTEFETTSARAKYCSDACKQEVTRRRQKAKSRLLVSTDKIKEEGAVCCAICGLFSHNLSSHIAREHSIKAVEYKEKYNAPVMSEKMLQFKSNRFRGEQNPAWQHGGRLSAYSKTFTSIVICPMKRKTLVFKRH